MTISVESLRARVHGQIATQVPGGRGGLFIDPREILALIEVAEAANAVVDMVDVHPGHAGDEQAAQSLGRALAQLSFTS